MLLTSYQNKLYRALSCLITLAVLALTPTVPALAQSGVFTAASASHATGDLPPTVVRQRSVTLDLNAFAGAPASADAAVATSDAMVLNLFDDAMYEAVQTSLDTGYGDSTIWQGHIVDAEESEVTLVSSGDVLAGNIRADGRQFRIRYAGDGTHMVEEVDPAAFPECGSCTDTAAHDLTPEAPVAAISNAAAAAPDDGSVIDVLVAYTPNARSAAGGTAAMLNTINLAIAETNTGYLNSGVIHRLNLVHALEVNYNSGGNFSNDLTRLQSQGDGVMDSVHTLRNTYGADAVVLLTNATAYCGLGYVMNPVGAYFEAYAFSVVYWWCATGNYSFGHELGHNFGSMHDRTNSGSAGSYAYSYGYRPPDGAFRTVMAYSASCPGGGACPRVNYWSNPNVNYGGQPTGIAWDQPDSADNRLSLNNNRVIAANWRTAAIPLVMANPNGGETLERGNDTVVTWTGAAPTGSVHLVLFRGSKVHSVIAKSVADTGSYVWTVPGGVPLGTNYRVRVQDAGDKTFRDSSDGPFAVTLAPCSLALTAPNGGEVWERGELATITWTGAIPGSTVDLLLFKGSERVKVIGRGIADTGSHTWTVPWGLANGSNYQVRIFASGDRVCRDVSDARFTITKPACTLQLTAPNGGETLVKGSSTTITWTGDGAGDTVHLMLFRGKTKVRTIVTHLVNTGSYSWTVPADLPDAGNYRILVRSALDKTCRDRSDAPFSIVAP